jgi:hypothetical protein
MKNYCRLGLFIVMMQTKKLWSEVDTNTIPIFLKSNLKRNNANIKSTSFLKLIELIFDKCEIFGAVEQANFDGPE